MRWAAAGGALLAPLLFTLTVGAVPAQAAASSSTTNLQIPIRFAQFVPCANGGAGELVILSGTLHELIHVTVDNRGGTHIKTHDNPHNVSGVGLAAGARYRGTGVTQQHINAGPSGLPRTVTFVNNFRIIGQGPGNNFMIHENVHITINPNGTVTASVDNLSVVCK